jgi:lipoyl(octanoyl) transferase
MPLFALIDLFDDPIARTGPEQMALDEALLETTSRPLLRPYRWAEPTVSFGYSQPLAQVRDRFPSLSPVRRWTGGGTVEHLDDWTFALIVPSGEPLARVRPQEAYRFIHSAVRQALNEIACVAHLAEPGDCADGFACFASPSVHDVLGLDRRKLCGGAQRRTHQGFLHQGSIQNVKPPLDFPRRLLKAFAAETRRFSLSPATLGRAKALAVEKYATKAWLERA